MNPDSPYVGAGVSGALSGIMGARALRSGKVSIKQLMVTHSLLVASGKDKRKIENNESLGIFFTFTKKHMPFPEFSSSLHLIL